MKIYSYNVNGIRSAISKDWMEWLKDSNADVLCLQEIKAEAGNIQKDIEALEKMGYHSYWYSAQKKGYSGVAIISKEKPLHVEYGCGNEKFDFEGRIIRADYKEFSLISVYMPSGSSGDERQQVKYEFLDFFLKYIKELKVKFPKLVISGDYNICHKAIDIHNPKSNANSSGFLPEERAWMDSFVENGFIDSFRFFNADPHHYSWWSFRANSRAKNLGWRIDYQMATDNLKNNLVNASILPHIKHSDHCPIFLELKF